MATQADVRRIAMSLAGTEEDLEILVTDAWRCVAPAAAPPRKKGSR